MKRPKVFISYSQKDKKRVKRLVGQLIVNDIEIWYDGFDVLVGHDIYEEVYNGITSSDYLAIILTKYSIDSNWIREELTIAKQKELTDKSIVILPLLYENVKLPPYLTGKKYIKFNNFNNGFKELMKFLSPHKNVNFIDNKTIQLIKNSMSFRTIKGQVEMDLISKTSYKHEKNKNISPKYTGQKYTSYIKIFLEFESIDKRIPFVFNSSQSIGIILAQILDILSVNRLDNRWYYLMHDGYLLEPNETLIDQEVNEENVLNIGYFEFHKE